MDQDGDETDFTDDDVDDFDPLEDLDSVDEDDDDEYGDEDDDEPIRYRDYMRIYAMEISGVPGVVESLADYLDDNEKWLSPDQPDKWRIGNALSDLATDVKTRLHDNNVSEEVAEIENRKLSNRLNELSVVYSPGLGASVMYEQALAAKRTNYADGIRKLRELIIIHPEHANALRDLSRDALAENDYDLAVALMERCVAVYDKHGWRRDGSQGDFENELYIKAGFHYAETGNYTASEALLVKYFAQRQPEVYKYLTRPDHQPEDIWIAMAEGYLQRAFPYQEPAEVLRRTLLFADIAIATNNSVKGHVARAAALLGNGQYEAAMVNILAGYAADPDYANVAYNHACLLSLTDAPVDEVVTVLKKLCSKTRRLGPMRAGIMISPGFATKLHSRNYLTKPQCPKRLKPRRTR